MLYYYLSISLTYSCIVTSWSLGQSISLRAWKCESLETMYSAFPQTAQSTNLLSSGSAWIKLKKNDGETLTVFSLFTIAFTMTSANHALVFYSNITMYSERISVETHHSTLPSTNSVHTLWYGLLDETHISRQLVSRTILLILHECRECACVPDPTPRFYFHR